MLLAALILANESFAAPVWTTLGEPASRIVADPCHPGREVEAVEVVQVKVSTTLTEALVQNLPTRPIDINALTRASYPITPMRGLTSALGADPDRMAVGFDEIGKTEVLRGPQGTLYGRDLYGGVIQAILKKDTELRSENTTFNCGDYMKSDGWTRIRLSYKPFDLWANTEVYRATALAGHPEPKLELLAKSNIYGGSYLRQLPIKTDFLPDNGQFGGPIANYYSGLGGIRFTSAYAQKLGTQAIYLPRREFDYSKVFDWRAPITVNPSIYLQDSFRSFGEKNVQGWIAGTGLELTQIGRMMQGAAAQGSGMSRLRFPGDPDLLGDPECGSEMDYPPGTIWYPDRAGYQCMMNTTRLRYQFPALWATTGVDGLSLQQEMESHCLNMALKEPTAGVRYYPYSSPDPLVSELAKIAESSMLRGPWDQARTWIYTDKASMDEINQRLLPRIGPSQYVNGLWDVVSRGGFGSEELKDSKFFDPKQLVAAGARDDAFRWFATQMGANFGEATAQWIESNPQDMQRLFAADASELDRKHLPRLFKPLLSASNARVRKAALALLASQTAGTDPLKGAVGALRRSLYSDDAGEVEAALGACERFVSKLPEEAIRYLAAKGANDAIKAKAAALAARL